MALNDVYRASMIYNHPNGDGDLVVTRHYRTTVVNTVVSGAVEAIGIALELNNNTEIQYLPFINDDYTYVECNVIGITDPLVGVTAPSGLPGQLLSAAVALRSAPVIKLSTGVRGRSFNGRNFLMAPSEDRQENGVLTGTHITEIDTYMGFIQRLAVNPENNIYDSTIFSLTLSTPPTIIVDTLVTGHTVNATLGSQRGRQKV